MTVGVTGTTGAARSVGVMIVGVTGKSTLVACCRVCGVDVVVVLRGITLGYSRGYGAGTR